MFGPYVQVLRQPGAARFSAAAMLARMQISMAGLGAVLLFSVERDSFAIAGIVSATYALSAAAIGPQISRLIDAFGQRRVVPLQLAVHVPAVAGMVLFALTTSLNWPVYVLAFVAGASQPIIGALVRARWSRLLSGTPQLRTAFAWESLIDEMIFILGPPLATIVALQFFSSAALILATAFLTVGTFILLTQRSTEPPASGRAAMTKAGSVIRVRGVGSITAIFVLMGGIFGSFEVTTVAFTKAAGVPGAAGVVLALYAVGSLIAGLIFGALSLRASLLRQFEASLAALAVVTFPLPFLNSVWLLGAGLFVAGIACSPALISGTALLERIVPAEQLTEAMAWISSGLAVGIAVATPLAGVLIDAVGAATGYWVTAACGVLAAAVAAVVHRPLSAAEGAMLARGRRDRTLAGSPTP